jgi:PAS domain-containing protein
MPADEEMTINERRKYLKLRVKRYLAADRAERGKLLTEMEEVTGLHRKSLIRLLRQGGLERKARQKQRGRSYGPEVEDVIRVVWESEDYLCAERLTPSLLTMARHLAIFGEVRLTAEIERQLGEISESTVSRLLSRLRQDTPKLPRRGPEQANRLGREIPMLRIPWQTVEPGHFEVDLVHHSGPVTSGEYLHTLQMVDVATGWSERVGVFGRTQRAMERGFRHILDRLPFPIVQLHPDNGPEFLNDHLLRFFGKEIVGLKLTRSRPYHKNDNRNVEQKNYTLVRSYLGYDRIDSPAQCIVVNALYDRMWVYYNLFQPVLHLVGKERGDDGRVKRRWDSAKTPYERLLATGVLSEDREAKLTAIYARTNPRRLRREIHQIIESLWDQPQSALPLLERLQAVVA